MSVTCDTFCDSVTVIEVDPITPVLVAFACNVSGPGVLPAVYFTVTCPLLLVMPLTALGTEQREVLAAPLPMLNVAPLVFVRKQNVTFSFTLRFPLASVTFAVSVEVPAGLTVGGE